MMKGIRGTALFLLKCKMKKINRKSSPYCS